MMTDPTITMIAGVTAIIALAIVSLVASRGWGQWVALRRHEIDRATAPVERSEGAMTHTASRIDLADLRERVRKLEAIAAGVDL